MNKKELEIKVDSFRKIPNPYKEGPSSVSQMYTAICDVKDLPEDFLDWMETNPRKQNIRHLHPSEIVRLGVLWIFQKVMTLTKNGINSMQYLL